jgi:uncharacterized protein YciI
MTEPLFAIIARDAPGGEALRAEHREAHLAHFRAHAGRIALGGPLFDQTISGAALGSLVIYRAGTEAEARAFIEADPFARHGVFATIDVLAFRAASGAWSKMALPSLT